MVGFLLMSHGELSKGVMSTFNCIMCSPEKIEALTLNIEDDISVFEQNVVQRIDELDDGDGVLIMVDLLGGTPCNKSSLLLKNKNIEIVTGLNFPMLTAAYECRMEGNNLPTIKNYCVRCAKEGIVSMKEHLNLIG